MALNALSNVTVNITSAPLAKSFVDIKTGLTVGLNCISFAFNTVKLLDSYMKYFYKNTNKCIKVIPNVVITNNE